MACQVCGTTCGCAAQRRATMRNVPSAPRTAAAMMAVLLAARSACRAVLPFASAGRRYAEHARMLLRGVVARKRTAQVGAV